MTRVAPPMATQAVAPPAQGPPGRGSRDFEPVLRSEGSRARPETSETSARTARAEGTTPRADDPGASRAEATERRPADAPRDGRPSDDDATDHDANGVGPEVSAAAHRAHYSTDAALAVEPTAFGRRLVGPRDGTNVAAKWR